MKINNLHQAKNCAIQYLKHDTIVVTEDGDIHASCDIDNVVSDLKKEKKNYFIVKGELKSETTKDKKVKK